MSSLVEELKNPPKPRTFAEWRVLQPPEIIAALEEAARDNQWTDWALEQKLREHKAVVSSTSLKEWRDDVTGR